MCVHSDSLSLSLPLFSLRLLGQHALTPPRMYFPNKTELLHGAITLSESYDAPRGLTSVASNFCCDKTEPRKLHIPLATLIDKGKVNIGVVFLVGNHMLHQLCKSQLPEHRESKQGSEEAQSTQP